MRLEIGYSFSHETFSPNSFFFHLENIRQPCLVILLNWLPHQETIKTHSCIHILNAGRVVIGDHTLQSTAVNTHSAWRQLQFMCSVMQ